ncbi:MAG: IS110 family transposase [Candidatus Methanoplasma sp.]|nr:IS110 family transposase [Candidatus Methanoplasma sp.]
MNEKNQAELELSDFDTTPEGFMEITERYSPLQCRILIENSTRSHFVEKYFKGLGYDIVVAHAADLPQIGMAKVKNDRIDARKLAEILLNMTEGRQKVKLSRLSDDENMKDKALCRMCAECTVIKNQMILRIQEYVSLHNIVLPESYKSVDSSRSVRFLRKENDPALNMMLNMMEAAINEIEKAEEMIEERFSGNEDVNILMTMKGIGTRTASTLITAIDGIERFDHPDKLVSYFGLNPQTRESAGKRRYGRITKDGDPLVRFGLANVVMVHSLFCRGSQIAKFYRRMSKRMPHWKAVTATARKIVCAIWAMLTRKEPFRSNPA